MSKKSFNEKVNYYFNKLMNESQIEVADWIETEEGKDFISDIFIQAEETGEVTRFDIGTMLHDYGISADASYIKHFVQMLRKAGHRIV